MGYLKTLSLQMPRDAQSKMRILAPIGFVLCLTRHILLERFVREVGFLFTCFKCDALEQVLAEDIKKRKKKKTTKQNTVLCSKTHTLRNPAWENKQSVCTATRQ